MAIPPCVAGEGGLVGIYHLTESNHIPIIHRTKHIQTYLCIIQTEFKIYLLLTFSVVAYVKLPNLIAISPLLTDLEERRGGKRLFGTTWIANNLNA